MRFVTCLLTLLLVSNLAWAEVNVALGNGDKVRGSLGPADEVESFRVTLPRGAVLSVSLKGKKAKGSKTVPSPTLTVLRGKDDVSNGQIVKKGVASKLKKLVVDATAEYTIRVTGDGVNTGEYDLKVKWKERKKVGMELVLGEGDVAVPFSAGAGALVDLAVKATKGSPALPQLVRITRIDKGILELPPRGPATKSDKEKKFPVPDLDDYELLVTDGGNEGGAVVVQIKVKQAKPSKRKVRITDKQIGTGGSNSLALGELIDDGGGGFVIDQADNDEIAGSGIDIPPDALSGTSVIVIGTAPDIESDDESEDRGPPVFFGPEGQRFAEPVTVTIPFDVASFGGDFSALRIVQRDAKGRLTTIDPLTYVIDDVAGTVSFPVSHFTAFQVFGPVTPVPARFDLNADGIDDLVVNAPEGNSGMGVVYVFFGGANLESRGTAQADVTILGTNGGEMFGETVEVGDVSGDGIADLVASSALPGQESVLVFLGGAGFSPVNSAASDFALFASGGDGDLQVRHLADLTGDDVLDVVVGAESANADAGAAYVFEGGANLLSQSTATAFAGFVGGGDGDLFGADVKVADVTGDGIADVIVGADQPDIPGADGQVFVFAGPVTAFTFEMAANADITFTGEPTRDGFGLVLGVGDLNGDEVADIVVSQGVEEDNPTSGRIYTFFGGATLADRSAAAADLILNGEAADDLFGFHLEVGDWTGDGIDDLLLGAPGQDSGGADAGAVYFFVGRNTFATHTVAAADKSTGSFAGDRYNGVRQPAALLGDGKPVFVTFSSVNDVGGMDGGEFYVQRVLGLPSQADVIITGRAGEFLGGSMD